jgi:hypothetical protein
MGIRTHIKFFFELLTINCMLLKKVCLTSSSSPSAASPGVHAPHVSSSPPTAHASASRMIPFPASPAPSSSPAASPCEHPRFPVPLSHPPDRP